MRIGPTLGLARGGTAGPGIAARLHLDFTKGLAVRDDAVVPLDQMILVSRASAGFLDDGREFAADTARRSARGLLIEEARTNLVANAFAPADQTVSLGVGSHVLSVGAGGSAAISGAASGSATPQGPVVFNMTEPGDVELTVTGSPLWVQIEAGVSATSPIASGGGAGLRAGDVVSLPETGWLTPATCRVEVEWEQLHDGSLAENGVATLMRWSGPAGYSRLRAGSVSFAQIRADGGSLAVNAGEGGTTPTGIHRLIWQSAGADHTVSWSEGMASGAGSVSAFSEGAATAVESVHLGSNGTAEFLNGWLRRITVT